MPFDTSETPEGKGASYVGAPAASLPMGGGKVSMKMLPPGTKIGDTVELTVTSIDGDMAELSSEESGALNEPTETTEDEGTPAAEENPAKNGVVDTGLLSGPLDKLKNYLAQKSVDHQTVA